MMMNRPTKRSARRHANRAPLPANTSVSAAVLFALYGVPHVAAAQQAPAAQQQLPHRLPPSSENHGDCDSPRGDARVGTRTACRW